MPHYTHALLWEASGQRCSHQISPSAPLPPLHGWGSLWEESLGRLSGTGHPLPEPGHGHTNPWCSASEIICPWSGSKYGHSQLRHQEQISCTQFWLTTAGNGISFNPYQVSKAAKTIPLSCGWERDGHAAVLKAHCSWRGSSSSPSLCTAGQSQICTVAQKKGVVVMGVWLQSYDWGITRKAGTQIKAWVLHSNMKSNKFWASSTKFKWNPNQRQSEFLLQQDTSLDCSVLCKQQDSLLQHGLMFASTQQWQPSTAIIVSCPAHIFPCHFKDSLHRSLIGYDLFSKCCWNAQILPSSLAWVCLQV